MRRVLRENALCAFLAGGGCALMAWLGLYGYAWNDYDNEARPALDALVQGHVLEFLRLAPAYGGSVLERAPFALLARLWGGGDLAVYRMLALPCLAAAAALGVWLCARMRSEGRPALARALVLGLCVANPLTLDALELGHSEELLGACMCVAAVLCASRDRPIWAGALLGLAIANKEWAVLAAGPVLLALPPRQSPEAPRARAHRRPVVACLVSAAGMAGLVLGPLTLVSGGGFLAGARAAALPPTTLFQPWQAWWFLGSHGALLHGQFGIPLPGYRLGPSWISRLSHPLIVAVGVSLAGALWMQRGRRRRVSERDALLMLALLLLLRCMLDTWNTGYYMLPCLIALLAWEARGASHRLPLLTLLGLVLPWLALQELSAHGELSAQGISPDAQAIFFLAWTLPLAVGLALKLYAPALAGRLRAQEITVSSLDRLVRSS